MILEVFEIAVFSSEICLTPGKQITKQVFGNPCLEFADTLRQVLTTSR